METRKIKSTVIALIVLTATVAFAQSESSFEFGPAGNWNAGGDDAPAGLLDPSRFQINHAMSFYAGGTSTSNVQSQSMYSTMIRYHFDAPIVLSLNFDMPIHSTFNQFSNLTNDNLQSLDYFRNMPIDAAISWMPSDRFMLGLRVIKMPEEGTPLYLGRTMLHRPYSRNLSPFYHDGMARGIFDRHPGARER